MALSAILEASRSNHKGWLRNRLESHTEPLRGVKHYLYILVILTLSIDK